MAVREGFLVAVILDSDVRLYRHELGRGQWDEDFQALVASDPSVT